MYKYLISVIIVLFSLSCTNSKTGSNSSKKKSILQTSTGRTYEMLVVIDNKSWNSALGDSIKKSFGNTAPWLFAEEAYFDITRIKPENFGNLYKMYRNILIVNTDRDVKKPKLTLSNNVYAKPQKIVKLTSSNIKSAIPLYTNNFGRILREFNENEVVRVQNVYKGLKINSIREKIQKDFNIDIIIPKGFYVAKRKENFMWLRKETRHISEGIIIYTRPYLDTIMLEPENIIDYRNQITKKEIPGPVDSSFMKTSDAFPAYTKEVNFHGNFATLIRSWWDLENYPMGGPYMSYTFSNQDNSKLITIEGYIYAPKKDKRDLLIHIESILNTFKFVNKSNTTK